MSLAGATMGRPKGKRTERDDIAVKLGRAVAGKAKAVATHRGISVAEYLTNLARGLVDKDYALMLRELDEPKSP